MLSIHAKYKTSCARTIIRAAVVLVVASWAGAQDLDFRLIAVSTPTGSSTTTTLPGSLTDVCVGQAYFIEFWVSDVGVTNTGVSSAYIDLLWPAAQTTAASIDHGTLYNLLASGTILAGMVDELGGSVLSANGVGIAPEWARVAVVEFTADAAGASLFTINPSSTGAAALGRGVIPWANVALGGVTVTVNALPGPPTGVLATPATICAGGSSTLTATVGAGGNALEWFEGSCEGTPVAGQSPVVSPTVTTNYFARTLNTLTGCISACVQVTVTVTPLPPAPTGVAATDGTFCDRVEVSFNLVGGATAYAVWRNTSNNSGTATQIGSPTASPFSDATAIPQVTYWYWVAATNVCGSGPLSSPDTGFAHCPDQPISGTVTTALTNPLNGVQVAADNGGGFDTTNASGNYQLFVPHDWSGTITPCLTGWRFTPSDLSFANVTAPVSGADFVGTQVYDLDPPSGGDEIVSVGDFSFFAPCWQQPVPPNDPCDFDCDGFVGGADFSFFITAWLKPVFDPTVVYPPCRQCGGPLPGPQSDVGLELRLVAVAAPTTTEQVHMLPPSIRQRFIGEDYFVEMWVRDLDGTGPGVTSAYAHVGVGDQAPTVRALVPSEIFGTFPSGSINKSIIADLGGSAMGAGVGTEGMWARIATIELRSSTPGPVDYELFESTMGFAAYGRGYVPWSHIKKSGVSVRHVNRSALSPIGNR